MKVKGDEAFQYVSFLFVCLSLCVYVRMIDTNWITDTQGDNRIKNREQKWILCFESRELSKNCIICDLYVVPSAKAKAWFPSFPFGERFVLLRLLPFVFWVDLLCLFESLRTFRAFHFGYCYTYVQVYQAWTTHTKFDNTRTELVLFDQL